MCKILVVTNTKKITDLKQLVKNAHSELKSQRDGFGWAALDLENKFFGERTNDVHAFESTLEGKRCPLPYLEGVDNANEFGEFKKETRAFIAHGRISTNNKALVNVHPIIRNDWALIHNGVVTDHGPKYDMLTSNDSEHVLKHLQDGGIETLSASLTGYYAFAGFDPEGNLHIARDKIADLYVCWVESMETFVYGTTKDLVKDFCKAQSWWTTSLIMKMKDDIYAVHKPDGSYVWERFSSLGRDAYSSGLSELSLGRSFSGPVGRETYEERMERWRANGYIVPDTEEDADTMTYAQRTAARALIAKSLGATPTDKEPAPFATLPYTGPQRITYSKQEQNQIRQDMYKDLHHDDKASLKKFFRYINDTKNQFWIFDVKNENKTVAWKDYVQWSPYTQLNCEIVDMYSHEVIDPYNMPTAFQQAKKDQPLLSVGV